MTFSLGRWLALLLACFIAGTSLPAHAERTEDRALAGREEARGETLLRAAEYEAALEAYRRAFELHPSVGNLRGIAATCAILRMPLEELEAHERLLRDFRSELSPERLAHSEKRVAELSALFGELGFDGFAPGTDVVIDGRSLGTLPLAGPVRLPVGPHDIELRREGYQPRRERIELAATGVRIEGPLAPLLAAGRLEVTVAAGDAGGGEPITVYVDDVPKGPAPWSGELAVGTYRVRGASARFASGVYNVQIARGHTQRLQLDVVPLPATVLLVTEWSGVTLKLDGRVLGTHRFEGSLPAGRYELVAEYPGYHPFVERITLEPGQRFERRGIRLGPPLAPAAPVASPSEWDDSTQASRRDDSDEYEGLYGYVDLFAMMAPESTHAWESACPGTSCTTTTPFGGGLGVRVGYSFGALGLELMALGAVDYHAARTELPSEEPVLDPAAAMPAGTPTPGTPPATPTTTPPTAASAGLSSGIVSQLVDQLTIVRGGGILGGALRLTSKTPVIRFTGAAGGGVALRTIFSNVSLADGSSESYAAPAVVLDGGILLGDVIHLGAFASFEFIDRVSVGLVPRNLDVSDLPAPYDAIAAQQQSVGVFRGTQTFFGLLLGLHFGA